MNSRRRAEGLDGLRAVAAAAVVLLHVWMFGGAHQAWQPVLTDQIVGSLGLAVMLFFALSGVLIVTPWVRAAGAGTPMPNLPRYALRRVARIFPAYLVCVTASFFLMRRIDHPLAIDAGQLPTFLLFAQNQFEATAGRLNPPLWSLGIEMSFYLAVPLIGVVLVAALRRAGARGGLAICGLLVAAGLAWNARTIEVGTPSTMVNALPTYLPVFACGIAAAILLARHELSRLQRGALLVGGAALVYLDARWHVQPTGWLGHVVRDLPAGAGFAMIAGAVAQGPAWLLGTRPMRELGNASYGIYLWHMPVIYVLRDQAHWPISPWEAYARVLLVATVLGLISWRLIERPAIAWAARLERRRGRVPSAMPVHAASVGEHPTGSPRHGARGHAPARPRLEWAARPNGLGAVADRGLVAEQPVVVVAPGTPPT